MKFLVTGGAGFIGSHLVDKLIEKGHKVTIIDDLSGNNGQEPPYLNKTARFIKADISTYPLKKIIPGFDGVFHLASKVGIAQSNYDINSFVQSNCAGTANLLNSIVNAEKRPKLVISASNTQYGEGIYKCEECGHEFHPQIRSEELIREDGLEYKCEKCKGPTRPIPTKEEAELHTNSIYALTKKFQEETSFQLGKMYDFPVAILRYFNVFGPRQSLSNPYTGVAAIFLSRMKNNNPPVIYEDGNQTRDFVSVHDVVQANLLAMENEDANFEIFNVGSGKPTKIKDLSQKLSSLLGKEFIPEIRNNFRKGDIRHCVADSKKIKEKLGWTQTTSLEEGLKEIIELSKDEACEDHFEKADKELKEKNLI